MHHPDHPYDDLRVSIHLTDGRRFTRRPLIDPKTGKQREYDLAIYALVDSLVLHSGYSSIRLENFLFTKQAFEDIKSRLKPGGMFIMYNYYRQGWVVARLKKMATEVFGVEPVVISIGEKGAQEEITSDTNESGFRTFLLVGKDAPRLEAIRKKVRRRDLLLEQLASFGERADQWLQQGTARPTARLDEDLSRRAWTLRKSRIAIFPSTIGRSFI
jgi:spermidine synthase